MASAVIYNGSCPNITTNLTRSTFVETGRVLFYTKVESKINHLFYNDAPNLKKLQVILKLEGSEFRIIKLNNGLNKCNIHEVLVADKVTGHLKQEIRMYNGPQKDTNVTCGSYWDRYQVLLVGEFVLLWGCVELKDTFQHEEGLWVFVMERNQTYLANYEKVEKDAWKVFPVGLISMYKVHMTTLDPEEPDVQPPKFCAQSQIACKLDKVNESELEGYFIRKVSLLIFFVVLVVGAVYYSVNC